MKGEFVKKMLITLGIVIVLIIGAVVAISYYFLKDAPDISAPIDIATFIKNNPERASIYLKDVR